MNETYPHTPGHQEPETSVAACLPHGRAKLLRDKIMTKLEIASLSADQMARILDESILSIRPRFSELVALNKIEATDQRDRTASGKRSIIWRIKQHV